MYREVKGWARLRLALESFSFLSTVMFHTLMTEFMLNSFTITEAFQLTEIAYSLKYNLS